MNISNRTATGRECKKNFSRQLEKDGFNKLYSNLYIRYCYSMANALVHKKRIMEAISGKCQISVIIVDDKHNETSYHYLGRKQKRKNDEILLKKPDLIEFF